MKRRCCISSRSLAAVTLVEVLVVTAIVAILIGIVLPSLIRSRRAAAVSSDISSIKQIGLAASLYQESFGRFPSTPQVLVYAGYIPESICGALTDKYNVGVANVYLRFNSELRKRPNLQAPFKQSYITPAMFGYPQEIIERDILPLRNPGWLIYVGIGKTDPPEPREDTWIWSGPYLRLLYDGAVVRRNEIWRDTIYEGAPAKEFQTERLFGD